MAGGHCWTCHTTKSIKDLCGCEDCYAKAIDYNSREAERVANRNFKHNIRARAKSMSDGS